MRRSKMYIRYMVAVTAWLAALMFGCRPIERLSALDVENRQVDSLVTCWLDSVSSCPVKAKDHLLAFRSQVKDSINFYKLSAVCGLCYYHIGQLDSARFFTEAAWRYHSNVSQPSPRMVELRAYSNNYIAVMLQEAGQRDSAVSYLEKAYQALMTSPNRQKLPDVCINLADNHYQCGRYVESVQWYRRALSLSDSLHMGEQVNHAIYCGLGHLYTDIGNYSLANSYYVLAEREYPQLAPYEQFFFANTRGNYYYVVKEYPEALPWFYRALALGKQFPKPIYRSIAECNLGEVYLLMGQTDSARCYLDRAGELFRHSADPSVKYYFNGLRASLALQQNRLDEAQRLLSMPFDPSVVNPYYRYLNAIRLEELYAKQGNYAEAYRCRRYVQQYDDSLRTLNLVNSIAEIDYRYQQDTMLLRRDMQLAQHESSMLRLHNINVVLGLTLIAFLLLACLLVVFARRRREREYASQMATITRLRMENVRNRLSPHFIFNALNAVVPALRRYDDLSRPLRLLVQSIRGNLLYSDQLTVHLKEELDMVRNYVELRRSLAGRFPDVEWRIDPQTDLGLILPSMLIQIPVENALKYAFPPDEWPDEETPRLFIDVKQEGGFLCVVVEDNGVGLRSERFDEHMQGTGSGLHILFRTAELWNKKNVQKIEIGLVNLGEADEKKNGIRFTAQIPLHFNYKL